MTLRIAGLVSKLQQSRRCDRNVCALGRKYRAIEIVSFQWQSKSSRDIFTIECFVVDSETAPFDVVVGGRYMEKHDLYRRLSLQPEKNVPKQMRQQSVNRTKKRRSLFGTRRRSRSPIDHLNEKATPTSSPALGSGEHASGLSRRLSWRPKSASSSRSSWSSISRIRSQPLRRSDDFTTIEERANG